MSVYNVGVNIPYSMVRTMLPTVTGKYTIRERLPEVAYGSLGRILHSGMKDWQSGGKLQRVYMPPLAAFEADWETTR